MALWRSDVNTSRPSPVPKDAQGPHRHNASRRDGVADWADSDGLPLCDRVASVCRAEPETTIELDDNAEKKLLISFNISLPHVPCHVASVDVKDVLGTRIANVTQNVFKRPSVLQKCPGSTDHAQRPARS